jgi:hypothetical protein
MSRNFSGLKNNLDPGACPGPDPGFAGETALRGLDFFLSPFEGLIFSSLRLCRRYVTVKLIDLVFTPK